jgi:hypothetical protein
MRLMYVETIQANNVKHVVAKAEACTQPTFDHRTVAIHLNIVLGWRLRRERRLSAQGECSTGGDATATVVATFTTFYVKRQDCMIGLSHVVNSCGAGISGDSSSLDGSTVDLRCGRLILTGCCAERRLIITKITRTRPGAGIVQFCTDGTVLMCDNFGNVQ